MPPSLVRANSFQENGVVSFHSWLFLGDHFVEVEKDIGESRMSSELDRVEVFGD